MTMGLEDRISGLFLENSSNSLVRTDLVASIVSDEHWPA